MNNVTSIQIEYLGSLETLADLLELKEPLYDTDCDEDGDYEYVYGKFHSEKIEFNRLMDNKTAAIFTHNTPSVFSSESFEHVMSTLSKNGIKVLSYQTTDDVSAGVTTKVI